MTETRAHEALRRRTIMQYMSQNSFYTKEHSKTDPIDERKAEITD